MNQGRRLLFYISLNILVSACTTLAVLWFWDRPHQVLPSLLSVMQLNAPATTSRPTPTSVAAAGSNTSPTAQAGPSTSLPPAAAPGEAAKLSLIDNVFGIGNLKDEYVLLKRDGDEISLTGWKLDDGNGNTYTFPSLTLFRDGAVQVHTAAGVNTVVDLFWGRGESVWQVGKIVTLTDDKGNVRDTYRIP